MLADVDLRDVLSQILETYTDAFLGPNSVDVTLDDSLYVPMPLTAGQTFDLRRHRQRDLLRRVTGEFTLAPGGFALASTRERVTMPDDLVGLVVGKSTIARAGLQVEAAGLIDSGFEGHITLELVNLSPWRVVLFPGMRIAQLTLWRTSQPVERPYGSTGLTSHYQGQAGATPAAVLEGAA